MVEAVEYPPAASPAYSVPQSCRSTPRPSTWQPLTWSSWSYSSFSGYSTPQSSRQLTSVSYECYPCAALFRVLSLSNWTIINTSTFLIFINVDIIWRMEEAWWRIGARPTETFCVSTQFFGTACPVSPSSVRCQVPACDNAKPRDHQPNRHLSHPGAAISEPLAALLWNVLRCTIDLFALGVIWCIFFLNLRLFL